jgi:hypothetical protein
MGVDQSASSRAELQREDPSSERKREVQSAAWLAAELGGAPVVGEGDGSRKGVNGREGAAGELRR